MAPVHQRRQQKSLNRDRLGRTRRGVSAIGGMVRVASLQAGLHVARDVPRATRHEGRRRRGDSLRSIN